NNCRILYILAKIPRATLIPRSELQITPGHVQAAGIAEDQFVCALDRHLEAGRTDHDDEFHLVVEIARAGRVGDGCSGFDERLRRLGEVEELPALLVDRLAHLDGMRMVVQAY